MAPSLGPTVVSKKASDLLVHVFPQVIRLKINVLSESFLIFEKENSVSVKALSLLSLITLVQSQIHDRRREPAL